MEARKALKNTLKNHMKPIIDVRIDWNPSKAIIIVIRRQNQNKIIFQAEHALYTPGLDENQGSSDIVHDIWICFVDCTSGIYYRAREQKFCTLQ